MKVDVIGGSGAFPFDGQPCSGYLVELDGFRLLIDPGYGVATHLPVHPGDLNAVYVSHGHPDHYADLHPLLRASVLTDVTTPLEVHAPPRALLSVLRLDGLNELDGAYELNEFEPGDKFTIGPFKAATKLLPHFVPDAGVRLEGDTGVLAYTGDTGPSRQLLGLAEGADIYIAEATFPEKMPDRFKGKLSTAEEAGAVADAAGVSQLVLTHLWPDSAADEAVAAARRFYNGRLDVGHRGLAATTARMSGT